MSNTHLRPSLKVESDGRKARPFSYLRTPVEMQPPTFPSRNQAPTPILEPQHPESEEPAVSIADTKIQPLAYTTSQADPSEHRENTASPPPPFTSAQITPTPPPISEHPAQFAPYADPPTPISQQPQQQPQQQPRTNSLPPQPASPGPLPPKHDPTGIIIEPDGHPLTPPPTVPAPTYSSIALQPHTELKTPQPDNLHFSHVPGQVKHPRQEAGGRNWSHSLCDCMEPSVCCLGFLCPCALYGRTQYRLSLRSAGKDPTNLLGHETCNASCAAMALLCGCQWLLATVQHSRTRRAYGIQGGIASDCVRAACCTCCTLIQDEREIKLREEASRVHRGGPGTGSSLALPYTAPGQMVFSPPPR